MTQQSNESINTVVPKIESPMKNPWPGLASYKDPSEYTDGTKYKFCGRSSETFDLLQMIESRNVVTLYGSTGVGKTSLLRAGVFPILKQRPDVSRSDNSDNNEIHFYPLYIRLSAPKQLESDKEMYYDSMSLSEILILCIEKELNVQGLNDVNDEEEQRLLWDYFHSHIFYDREKKVTPVIVLDQFEELFTKQENDPKIKEFLKQLYVLSENRISWREVQGLHEAAFRFVITIREDRFFYLEDCIDSLHLFLFKENRYRLRPLDKDAALQIVTIPGQDVIDHEHEAEISSYIINKARNTDRQEINTLMLSLICNQIYEKEGKLTLDTAQDINLTLDSYYQSAINGLSNNEIRFIEKYFVNGDNRQPVEETLFKNNAPTAYNRFYKNEDSTYKIITDIVVPGKNVHHVELIHDQLAAVINARQKEKNKKWKNFLLRSCIVTLLSIAGLLVVFCGDVTINKQKQPLSVMRLNAHDFSTTDSLWIDQQCLKRNALVEKLYIKNKTAYTIEQCPYLQVVDLTQLGRDSLSLTLNDCDMLEKILLPSHLKELTLIINNCPKLTLSINKGLGTLFIEPMEELLTVILEPNVERYYESGGVIWDLYDRRIVYYPRAQAKEIKNETFSYPFPPSIKTDKLKYGSVTLTNINYQKEESLYSSSKGVILSNFSQKRIDTWNKSNYEDVNYIVLPDSIDYLPEGIFKSLILLDSISMPRKLKEIRPEAFMDCPQLRIVTFPHNLQIIGEKSFYGCKSLKHIVIPAEVTKIEKQAFEGCISLESVVFLGDSIMLGDRAFANCPKLEKVILPPERDYSAKTEYYSPFFQSGEFEGKEYFSLEQNDVIKKGAGYELAWNNTGEIVIRLHHNTSEIFIPTGFIPATIKIEPNTQTLYHIHVPWPQPVFIRNNQKYKLAFDLNNTEKQHITLHVPFGCRRYYEMNSDFDGFRNIVEDKLSQHTKNWINNIYLVIKRTFERPLMRFLFLLSLLVILTANIIVQRKGWYFISLDKTTSWKKNISYSLLFCVLAAISFTICFWFYCIICSLNDICSIILAAVSSLILTSLFIAPKFFFSLRYKQTETTESLSSTLSKDSLSENRKVNKTVLISIGLICIITIGIKQTNLFHQNNSVSKALANYNYKKAINLYIDSLIQKDSFSSADCLRLRELLTIAKDSAQLLLYKKESYDNCNKNYELPWNVQNGISYKRGDSIFIYNYTTSAVWADKDIFGHNNKCLINESELTVSYYDEISDSSALVFLKGNVGILKIAGKITNHDASRKMVFSSTKDGEKIFSDYNGQSITYDTSKDEFRISYLRENGIIYCQKEYDGPCYVFINTKNGPICMILPNGNDTELIDKQYLIWNKKDGQLFAYDINNPQKEPFHIDNEGFFEIKPGKKLQINKQKNSGPRITRERIDGQYKIVANETKQSFILPQRYTNIKGSISYDLVKNRYYWQSDYLYGELAFFDLKQDGKLIKEIEGTKCSFLKHPDNTFYVIEEGRASFYIIYEGCIIKTFIIENDSYHLNQNDFFQTYTIEQKYHYCGNSLIYDEDCNTNTNHYARIVYSLTIPGAKQLSVVNQPVFASGDDIIIVNPKEKCFYFYRYETMIDQIKRSKIINNKHKKELKNLILNSY